MYHTYSVNDMPRPVIPTPKPESLPESESHEVKKPVIGGIKDDDLILLLVIAMLILGNCDDKILLIALIYIFLSGYNK